MIIFILTCINESSDLVSCKAYKTANEAISAMEEQFDAEKKSWSFGSLNYAQIDTAKASIGNDEYCYLWRITPDEL